MPNNIIPKTIFRYENAEKQSIINLKSQIIYMSSPQLFNDPYDCALKLRIMDLSNKDINKLKTFYLQREDVPEKVKAELNGKNYSELKSIFQKSYEKSIQTQVDSFSKKNGVCCFTSTNSNLLMWAHYANSYRGYCLEYYTNQDPFSKIKHVQYTKCIPTFDILGFISKPSSNLISNLFVTKSIDWKYEKEWRLLHAEAGTEYVYPANSLKAIYFGPRISLQYQEIICLILNGQNPNVEFWNGSLNTKSFCIDFTRFEYTSFSNSKKS
jgi:hypothetical protein